MLLKLLFSLAAILPHHGKKNNEQQVGFVPTPHGPKTLEEEALARKALHGEHNGGDMILPDDWNTIDAGIKDNRFRWPGYPGRGVIPFVFEGFPQYLRPGVYRAMEQFHRFTCIRFVPRRREKDYIRIFEGRGCSSHVGRLGGAQNLSLGVGCNYVGMVAHELAHVVGLLHEHQRSDRNDYVTILEQNVIPGKLHHFRRYNVSEEMRFDLPYDYDSIMHYGSYAFSIQPCVSPTILAKNGRKLYEPYNKPGLNRQDIIMIRKLYECDGHHPYPY